jgi:hypothetical protein
MKHLINQYFRLPGEAFRQKNNFRNSLLNLPHLQNLLQKYIYPAFPENFKNQLNENFCWFFFALPSIKKQHIK